MSISEERRRDLATDVANDAVDEVDRALVARLEADPRFAHEVRLARALRRLVRSVPRRAAPRISDERFVAMLRAERAAVDRSAVADVLRRLPRVPAPTELRGRILADVREIARSRDASGAPPVARETSRGWAWPAPARVAAAAAILLACASTLRGWRSPRPDRPPGAVPVRVLFDQVAHSHVERIGVIAGHLGGPR